MDQAISNKQGDFERTLLSHVELCYAVAFSLTHNPQRAAALARETLSWAWQREGGADDSDAIKMMLLRDMRKRYLRHGRISTAIPAHHEKQLQEAGI